MRPDKLYVHYCPLQDFFLIARTIRDKFKKQDIIKRREIMSDLHKITLARGRVFDNERDSYKVGITLFVLTENGLARKVGNGKYSSQFMYLPVSSLQTYRNRRLRVSYEPISRKRGLSSILDGERVVFGYFERHDCF